MSDTDKYEGHTPAPWKVGKSGFIEEDKEYGNVIADLLYCEEMKSNAQLIADAPLLLEEVKRLHHALVFVTAKIYMNENGEPYDYEQLMGLLRGQIGEPDDMSGDLGKMISEWGEQE